jgi:hypothetical protein
MKDLRYAYAREGESFENGSHRNNIWARYLGVSRARVTQVLRRVATNPTAASPQSGKPPSNVSDSLK